MIWILFALSHLKSDSLMKSSRCLLIAYLPSMVCDKVYSSTASGLLKTLGVIHLSTTSQPPILTPLSGALVILSIVLSFCYPC